MRITVSPTEIYIARVPFDEVLGSKIRPALVIENNDHYATVFKITSKFQHKSAYIQNVYYRIQEWQEAGLTRPSFVDIHKTYDLTLESLLSHAPIGKLTLLDRRGLLLFINQRNS